VADEEKVYEGEVVNDGGGAGGEKPRAENPREVGKARTYFEPLSGAIILGIDWLAFGADFFSGFLALAVVAVAAFAATFYSVRRIQLRAGDDERAAMIKALIGAAAAGVPFPVTGTIVGAAIIALSGLPKKLPGIKL
jgi:hypothetical protein